MNETVTQIRDRAFDLIARASEIEDNGGNPVLLQDEARRLNRKANEMERRARR
jgi:hypothetical protein